MSYSWYVVLLLTAAQIVSYLDRYLPSLVLDSIKKDLVLDDFQLGLMLRAGLRRVLPAARHPDRAAGGPCEPARPSRRRHHGVVLHDRVRRLSHAASPGS